MMKNIIYKVFCGVVYFLFLGTTLFAQGKLELSGKIRLMEPVVLRLESIDGHEIFKKVIKNNESFNFPKRHIAPDVYLLYFGDVAQPVYLTNTKINIKGFYNIKDQKNSSINIAGISEYEELMKWYPVEEFANQKTINPNIKGKLRGNMYSALAYIANMTTYEPNKLLLDCMDETAKNTLSGKWLQHRTDSLYNYSIGAPAYDFELRNAEGEKVKLSDFRGKIVLVDFWASWCAACRNEMKSLLPIYNDLKSKDLEFISISLDTKDEDWRKAMSIEKLPWVMLCDDEGFVIGNRHNKLQRAFGFYSIPFIVLIDKEGHLIARDLRGEQVREAILKARNK